MPSHEGMLMKIEVLKSFVMADAKVREKGDKLDLPPEQAKSLIAAGLAKPAVERAVKKPKKEQR